MRTKKKVMLICGCLLLVAAAVLGVYLARVVSYQREVRAIQITEPSLADIPDGRYIGECDVGLIYAKVEAEVRDGALARVEILEHRNERGGPAEQIVETIVQSQRIEADAVSGATNSSRVIEKALENALNQAGKEE